MISPTRHRSDAPLILTLELEKPMQDWAQTMRSRHFPAERNVVPAHITLFHALPADNLDVICSFLTSPLRAPFVRIEAPFLLGRGVAYRVVSPEMQEMRARLAARISQERFTAQDRAPWRPHLTIQNKVSPQQARELLESLSQGHKDRQTFAAALRLWRYLGRPWELLSRSPFTYTD